MLLLLIALPSTVTLNLHSPGNFRLLFSVETIKPGPMYKPDKMDVHSVVMLGPGGVGKSAITIQV